MNAKIVVLVSGLAVSWGASCKKDSEGKDKEATETYRRKSIATEAQTMLKLMSNNARSYYLTPNMDPNSLSMAIAEKQFPKSTAINPPLGSCCKSGGKCSPAGGEWEDSSWLALDFAVRDPHYYSYQFNASADGLSYTALAFGDIDCDGTYATYSVYGQVVDGEVQTTGDVISVNPLE